MNSADVNVDISITVNGRRHDLRVPPRMTLADCLRDEIGLTGTHIGCEQGACGACCVMLDGEAVRGCLIFAVQADGLSVTTVEGLAGADGSLSVLQDAFWDHHALQCGYCTPGMLVAATALLAENPSPSEAEIRAAIDGNLCRCTGYQQIIEAIADAAARMKAT
jgi:carbon-monoxide dehydrogenase small subunit